jgi:hypothetical protein
MVQRGFVRQVIYLSGAGLYRLRKNSSTKSGGAGVASLKTTLPERFSNKPPCPDVPESAGKMRTEESRIQKRQSEETKMKIKLRMRLRS